MPAPNLPTGHFVSASCAGQVCRVCGTPATHKVGEEIPSDDPSNEPEWKRVGLPGPRRGVWTDTISCGRHNLTAYVCCTHFAMIVGGAAPCSPQIRTQTDFLAELLRERERQKAEPVPTPTAETPPFTASLTASYDRDERVPLTGRYVAAVEENLRATLEMMRLAFPDRAHCWTWGKCEIRDLVDGTYFCYGGEDDRPADLPAGQDVIVVVHSCNREAIHAPLAVPESEAPSCA